MNPSEINAALYDGQSSRELFDALAEELSRRLGYRVVVDKVANRYLVMRVAETTQLLEQELMAAVDPLGFLAQTVQMRTSQARG